MTYPFGPPDHERRTTLSIRMSVGEKADLARAAEARGLGLGEYVRSVLAEAAERDRPIVRLSPEDQLALWTALNTPVELNEGQKRLAEIIPTSRIGRSPS